MLGKEIRLDSQPYTIVGVMPPALDFPPQTKIYVAIFPFLSEFSEVRGMHSVIILGRLAPGRTLTEAQAESTLIARRLEQQYPEDNRGRGVSLEAAGQALVRDVRRGLLVLLGAVVAVLMIACANIAGLLLSRAGARRREISIRTALGAGRFNVIRQLLVESVVLSLIGGAAGMVAGYWILKAMVALAPEGLPRASSIAPTES